MINLYNAIQSVLATALSGQIADVTPALLAADALTAEEVEALRTSMANPKDLSTKLSDGITMLKNAHALVTSRSLQAAN